MPIRTLAPSEEDLSTTLLDDRIDTADKAFQAAAAYAGTLDQEWLIGLCLNHTFEAIDKHQVFLSRTCQPAPLTALAALIAAALSCQPGSLVAVRHHAHPWRGPRTPGMRRFWEFWLQAEARGIILYDLVIGDSTGKVYSVRGDWEEALV